MDNIRSRFLKARTAVLSEKAHTEGVGGLCEKSIHKILKLMLDENTANHEVKFMGSIVDIKNDSGIFEIQTKNHYALAPKLRRLLPHSRVTVVIPLLSEKRVRWIDAESGEISSGRKSPKSEDVYYAFKYMCGLEDFIKFSSFSLKLIMLSADEYKRLDGWDKMRKKGATRIDRIPSDIISVIDLCSVDDYKEFIPSELGETFLSKDFAKAIKKPSRFAYFVLKFFVGIGLIEVCGKQGKAIIYKLSKKA